MAFDPTSVALGKKLGVVDDPRTFHLRTLLEPAGLPAIPRSWRMAATLDQVPMYANDRYGDCTCASQAHRILAQERSTQQHDIEILDRDVLAVYSAVTGFDIRTGMNDNGAYMLDIANYMRRTGMGREKDGSRHTVDAYVKVDHTSHQEVKTACLLFGGVWVGVWLPTSAQRQTDPNRAWDIPEGRAPEGDYQPGSWGGHAIHGIGYNAAGIETYTWGQEQFMSWRFWDQYVDEAYAFISEDWFRKSGTTPRGFNAQQLGAWLAELA